MPDYEEVAVSIGKKVKGQGKETIERLIQTLFPRSWDCFIKLGQTAARQTAAAPATTGQARCRKAAEPRSGWGVGATRLAMPIERV